jgi:hypothetical protein
LNDTVLPYFGRLRDRPIQTGLFGALPNAGYKLDVEKAKALLAEAGYPDGFSTTLRAISDAPFMNADERLQYSWDTYQKHLSLAKDYAAGHAGLSIRETTDNAFRNLSIYVKDQKLAIVTKHKDPRIAFVITHPNMVRAIRQFTAPVVETDD